MIKDYLEALNLYRNLEKIGNFKKIVICGMGGSAIAGDYIKQLLDDKIVEVIRDYNIPKWIDDQAFIICVSYSGNTEETLSCFKQAINITRNIIVITSGGKLEKLANDKGIKVIKLPGGFQPRFAFPYMFVALLSLLNKNLLEEVEKIIKESKIDDNLVKSIANDIYDKEIVIYAYQKYFPVAYRFKTQLNENSKLLCKVEYFPELNHNEIESLYYKYMDKVFIFLKGGDEPGRVKLGIDFVKDLLVKNNNNVIEIKGDFNYLKNLLEFTIFFDKLSLEVAKLRNVDPYNIENIRNLKKYLSENLT